MKIYNAKDGLLLDIAVDDTSYRYRVIMGDHNLTLRYSLAEHLEIPVGAYCDFQGARYTLERPEDFKEIHSRNFDYTVVFQSVEYKARIWKFRNPVDGRLKFPLTATPREHLQMFVDNMNRRDTGWTLGDYIDGTEVLINYDHDFCRDALAKMASELKTEYYFEGKRVSLRKLEVNKGNPLPLSYGRGNGFKSGVGRSNSGDNPPTEILFVQGGTDNIDRSKYPPLDEPRVRASSGGCLLLPRNASLQFDGDHFEDEDGFNPDLARTYVTDDLGLSLRSADRVLSSLAEDSVDCSSIYPKRVGEVSEVIEIKKDDGNLYDIIDKDIPESLDYSQCIIGEENMTIIFQTGMLAGKEFDVAYHHAATNISGNSKKGRRFEIVPQEIDGIMMPGDCFVPVKGDKYAVFHCYLPESYINAYTGNKPEKKGAEWDMFREAVKKLYDAEQLHFTFSGTLDGLWAKKDWVNIGGRIVLGGYVLFSDKSFEKEGVRVRITGIKDYVNNPHAPEIELSNSTISASVGTTLKELGAEEVTAEENYNSAIRFTRRRFRDAQETTTMLEKALLKNFSETINPVSVHTMQMLVGDESLQFEFVAYIPDEDATQQPPVVAHAVTWHEDTRTLEIADGIIKHLTIDIPKHLTSDHKPSAYHYWPVTGRTTGELSNAEQSYYLYAKVPRFGGTGEFRLEVDSHNLAEGNDYWLLVGVLNSEYGGSRSFATLYGFTEVLPGRVTTERVVSGDGESYFDMVGERMKLGDKLSYNADGNRELILRGTMVQSQSGQTEYIGCFRGEWNAEYTYFRGDEVTYLNKETDTTSTYRYISDTSAKGIVPTNTAYWQVIAQGSQGTPGVSPNTSFKATAFYRTNGSYPFPVGGSYASPKPTNGWSDGVPSGEMKLWMTTRVFSSDGKSPQESAWKTPVVVTDTADIDFEFSSVENPSAPVGHPNTNSEWSNEASEDTIWMATSRKSNGVWGDWQVMRVKGENGTDGTSLNVKGTCYGQYATKEEFEQAANAVDNNTIQSLTFFGKKMLIAPDEENNIGCKVGWVTRYMRPINGGSAYALINYVDAADGDAYVMNSDGHLYMADNSIGWVDIGQFKGDTGATGATGKSAYIHIKYANSETVGDWTDNNGETPGRYIGVYTDNNIADPACTDANWHLFTWSKWEGQDGLGYEYIYKRTTNSSAPATPTATSNAAGKTSNMDDFVPDGWTDDPTGVNGTYQWEWQCYRKKTNGVWGEFIGSAANSAVAALWAKYGDTGATGDYTEIRYASNGSTIFPPTFNASSLDTSIWKTSLTSVVASGYYVWQTSAKFTSSGVRKTSWTTPIRITGVRGEKGADGNSPALVFRGEYDKNALYLGTTFRVEAVRYKDPTTGVESYFVTAPDAGEFSGVAPTDSQKWNPFGASFDSVATQLLLAEFAYIENLGVRDLLTNQSGKRVHISEGRNAMIVYDDSDDACIEIAGETLSDANLFGGAMQTITPTNHSATDSVGSNLTKQYTVTSKTFTFARNGKFTGQVYLYSNYYYDQGTNPNPNRANQLTGQGLITLEVYVDSTRVALLNNGGVVTIDNGGNTSVGETFPISVPISPGTHTISVKVKIFGAGYYTGGSYQAVTRATFSNCKADAEIKQSHYFANGNAVGCASNQYSETLMENQKLMHKVEAGGVGISFHDGVLKIKLGDKWYTASRNSSGQLILS